MEIIISNGSDKPIYEQITAQVKGMIMAGNLKEGQKLPSIRVLANDLNISVITTKRAYADLETQGFIETVPGKGSFVAGGNKELMREEQLRRVEEALQKALSEAKSAGLELSDLIELLHVLGESDDNG